MNFRWSHDVNNTDFKKKLKKFLLLNVSPRKSSEDNNLSVKVKLQRDKMLAALRRGEKVCSVDDIKKYFTVKFIIKAFEEHQDEIIWDEETKPTMPAKEESDLPLTPTGGSVLPQPSHFSDEATKSDIIARVPIQQIPTSSDMDDEPTFSDGAAQYSPPLLGTPTELKRRASGDQGTAR